MIIFIKRALVALMLFTTGIYCLAQSGAEWQLIDAEGAYTTEDLGVAAFTDASEAGIDRTGANDSRDGIQSLLTRLGAAGGGTLYLRAGRYRVSGKLTIPHGVVLRGDLRKPVKGQPISGTVIMAYYGRGSEAEDDAFITMEPSTGLYNLAIWYPEQTPDAITPYPPTILYGRQGYWGNDYCNTRNVLLVNAYSGVILSRRNGGGCPNVYDLYGSPLSRGIEIDNIADVGRIDHVSFSPDYWAGSGLPGSPAIDGAHSDYIRRNATGIVMRRNDWSYTCYVDIEGYKIGFHAAPSIASEGSLPNGHNYGMTFRNCGTGIYIESVANAGIMFTGVKTENCGTGVSVGDDFASTAALLDCELSATSEAIAMSGGASGRLMTQQCRIASGKVNIAGGLYSAVDGDFNNAVPQVTIGAFARCILSGNRFGAAPEIKNNSLFECKIDHNAVSVARPPVFPEIRPLPSARPARAALYVVEGVNDALTDNTAAIQSALDKAGAEGGGVVFLPSGKYKVLGNLTVPAGVELKGASDVASVPKGQGSIIEVYAGKNDPAGTPFLRLSPRSGIRGLTFNYPETTSDMTANIATLPEYPYLIQATGNDVYIINIGVRATYKGIDLFTHRCDNHYVDYFAGHVFKNAIRVGGGSKNGIISNFQFNSLVYSNGYESPKFGGWPNSINTQTAKDAVYNQNWSELEFLIVEDCEDEILYNNFHYASHKGLVFRSNNGKAPSGVALGHGIDASMRAVCFEALDEKGFDMINSQIVSVARDVYSETRFIEMAAGFVGTARLFGSDYWGGAVYGCALAGSAGGSVEFHLANFQQAGATRFLHLTGSNTALFANSYCTAEAGNFIIGGQSGKVAVESSVTKLTAGVGYKSWVNNLTVAPVFTGGGTLSRYGWVATASGGSPYQAIDGNAATRWDNGSQVNPGQWFQIDTRMPVTFNTIILDASGSPNDYPKEYAVYVSNDGVNWGEPVATGSKASAVLIISVPDTAARYVRVVQTGSGKTQYWSIHEFYLANVESIATANEAVAASALSHAPVLYPNPVRGGVVFIAMKEIASFLAMTDAGGQNLVKVVRIYANDGRLVKSVNLGSLNVADSPLSIPVTDLPRGVYFFSIETAASQLFNYKIIIE